MEHADKTINDTILLVDDEADIREVMDIVLSDMGYSVLTAENGEEALNIFRKENPLIVLTDIKMPVMDGIELLHQIKQENPDTEVIMITGHGDMELAVQSLKYEATDFVTKPINDDVLEIALKRAKEKIALKAELRMYTENLERMVSEKTRQLLEAERLAAIGQTVAGLSHAIKNITGGLTGGMFVLEKGIDLENKEYLLQGWEMIRGNVDKIKNMALDMLNYAKERQPDSQLCNPSELAQDVADLMKPRAEKYGISLLCESDEGISEVRFDPEGIHRALVNLVTNAIDACADVSCMEKPGKVVLKTCKPESEENAVIYQITDNGCGMDETVKSKVFRNFFSTKGYGGTGLGLMITKKIIDEHGGTIEMNSEKREGTTFFIRLPASAGKV